MYFQLKRIILWPRSDTYAPRQVEFEVGKLNVITGASKTGKSAVIPIIDYCLGSERCAVPVQTIRDACSWFGIVVGTAEGEKLLARREPGTQQSTGDMFVLEGVEIQVPHAIETKNTNVDAVKRMLDRLAGLSSLGFDPTGFAGGFKGRPSFRDLLAFTLQPQNVVANPDVLFFKADTMEHKEKLRTIFPYVLGAMTPDLLAKRWELDNLTRELKRKERELVSQAQTSERWRAEIRTWVNEARDLGLADPDTAEAARSEKDLLLILQDVISKTSADADITESVLNAASTELIEIDHEEARVTLALSEVKSRVEHMNRLRSAVDDYTGALKKQRERLQLSRWLREIALEEESTCPLCGGTFEDAHRELDALCDALAEIEASARQLTPVPAVFDRELVSVRDDVRKLTDSFRAVRTRRRAVEQRSAQIRQTHWRRASIERFIGRTEQALKLFQSPFADDALTDEVARLRNDVSELRNAISDTAIKQRLAASLRRVSAFMARVVPALDAERPNDPPELNIEELTIRVVGASGRTDYLWEIGSGANWLSYHVAAMLGLQQFFMEQAANPVPSFLVFDQPSQVYFPRKLAREVAEGDDPRLADEDVLAVRKVFEVLGEAVASSDNKLQVIVLDHAGVDVWQQATATHLVDEWRGGKALVPQEWVSIGSRGSKS